MKVNLSEIDTYILTIPRNISRYNRIIQTLSKLEYKLKTHVYYGKDIINNDVDQNYLGCAISTVDMYKSITPPVLCLEDDCDVTEYFTNTLNIPNDADVVYLGTSIWGANDGYVNWRNFTIKKYNDDFYKIEGMCSTHAILFLNNNFLEHINKIGESYGIGSAVPFDYLMSQEQYRFNVYGVAKPMFYQNCNINKEVTLYSLEQIYRDKNLISI